jgi:hypothetical protein
MSGNFDFPTASDPNPPIGSLTARFDGLRQTMAERQERAAMFPTAFTPPVRNLEPTPIPRQPVPRLRRRSGLSRMPPGTSARAPPSTSSSSTQPRSRPRGAPPDRPSIRRNRQDMQTSSAVLREELRHRREMLDRVDNHLSGVEDTLGLGPSSNSFTDTERSHFANNILSAHRRLNKRRKLEHDATSTLGFPDFKYGHKGQVVPGELKMEIVGCDGGEYAPRDPSAISRENYRAENVLRDDKSVYCTKSPRCNLMLRHQGEALFHLESIVIKAPELGYTAP